MSNKLIALNDVFNFLVWYGETAIFKTMLPEGYAVDIVSVKIIRLGINEISMSV